MAKMTGIGARLFLAGYDVSGDIGSVQSIALTQALDDVTGLDKPARERLGLLLDGQLSFASYFNPNSALVNGAIGVHEIVKTLTGVKQLLYCHRPERASPAAGLVALQSSYSLERSDTGALRGSVQAQTAAGAAIEWGVCLTEGAETFDAPVATEGVDNGAASVGGWAAYLQVLDLDGNDITVEIEASSDDGDMDPYAVISGGAFAEVTGAPATQRIAGTGTLKRWTRVAVSGDFTSATLVVAIMRQ
jgi:hypothetical protein